VVDVTVLGHARRSRPSRRLVATPRPKTIARFDACASFRARPIGSFPASIAVELAVL
jgi:hypothetical protein